MLSAVFIAGQELVAVAPLSEQTHQAGEWDLLLQSQLLMVEVWNYGLVEADKVVVTQAALSSIEATQLSALYQALYAQAPLAQELPTGLPILSEADPRFTYQEEASKKARKYWYQGC